MLLARMGRRIGVVVAAVLVVWTPVAHAATLDTTAITCTFTPNKPVLNSAKQLSGSASMTCTNKSRSLQYVNMRVIVFELNSNRVTYNYMKNVYVASSQYTFRPGETLTFNLATSAKSCVSQETGNDEYGTEVTVTHVGSKTSRTDRFIPSPDSYSC